ncbi:MAG: tRNA (adenosine(37)-N6)-threonylcarbamoyltransferase complex ATPase subunit type 1 TsaE [Xanthomonadales bacterium]|nr:tRNA (adenosine(37)-N6)-threonylcarbamoyltransferase complex ATPase subunit type 1 TsaE [Xanthomonadales bacterium]
MAENPPGGHLVFPREQHLNAFAKKFASFIRVPLVIHLEGDLGAGKTTFARAFIRALGHEGRVKSPTYGLLEHYKLDSVQVLHMDLYRIGDPEELAFLGIEDLLDERTVLLVEWPERGTGFLPAADFVFSFAYAGEGRDLYWSALTERAQSFDDTAFIS